MKKILNKIYSIFFLGTVTFWAFAFFGVANAQEGYEPLVTIPGVNSGGNFSQYFNSLFEIAVLVGSILAVIIIAVAGIQYMTTDAVFQKKDSIKKIQMALAGLLMLLATFLFFNQIGGEEILKLKIDLPPTQGTGSPPPRETP